MKTLKMKKVKIVLIVLVLMLTVAFSVACKPPEYPHAEPLCFDELHEIASATEGWDVSMITTSRYGTEGRIFRMFRANNGVNPNVFVREFEFEGEAEAFAIGQIAGQTMLDGQIASVVFENRVVFMSSSQAGIDALRALRTVK